MARTSLLVESMERWPPAGGSLPLVAHPINGYAENLSSGDREFKRQFDREDGCRLIALDCSGGATFI
jgi:hypothetical protein